MDHFSIKKTAFSFYLRRKKPMGEPSSKLESTCSCPRKLKAIMDNCLQLFHGYTAVQKSVRLELIRLMCSCDNSPRNDT